jgi:hypothetical protein
MTRKLQIYALAKLALVVAVVAFTQYVLVRCICASDDLWPAYHDAVRPVMVQHAALDHAFNCRSCSNIQHEDGVLVSSSNTVLCRGCDRNEQLHASCSTSVVSDSMAASARKLLTYDYMKNSTVLAFFYCNFNDSWWCHGPALATLSYAMTADKIQVHPLLFVCSLAIMLLCLFTVVHTRSVLRRWFTEKARIEGKEAIIQHRNDFDEQKAHEPGWTPKDTLRQRH